MMAVSSSFSLHDNRRFKINIVKYNPFWVTYCDALHIFHIGYHTNGKISMEDRTINTAQIEIKKSNTTTVCCNYHRTYTRTDAVQNHPPHQRHNDNKRTGRTRYTLSCWWWTWDSLARTRTIPLDLCPPKTTHDNVYNAFATG